VFKTAPLMAKIGVIRQAPGSIDGLFFPAAAPLRGD